MPALVDVALGGTDRGDLGVGEDVGATPAQVQRRHGVAERVPHRDPALHRRHRGQRQHAGAVAGGVDAGDRRARDAVDLDVPGRRRARRPTSSRPRPAVCGHRADGQQGVRAGDLAAVLQPHQDAVADALDADAARERPSTSMPRRRKTSSMTVAASASSPGSTRSREETSTTSQPSPR